VKFDTIFQHEDKKTQNKIIEKEKIEPSWDNKKRKKLNEQKRHGEK